MNSWIDPYLDLLPSGARESGLLFIDVETQSEDDVRKVGAPRYSLKAEPVCWAYTFNTDENYHLWRPGEPLNWLLQHRGGFVAHNVEFESWILRSRYGLHIEADRWIDSAAVARYHNLPGKLEQIGEFMKQPKDTEGHKVMLKLCRPRRPSRDNPDRFWTPETKPEDFEKLYDYCKRDVHVSREVLRRFPAPSAKEREVMNVTFDMNRKGIPISVLAIEAMREQTREDDAATSFEVCELTGYTASQVTNLAEHLGMRSLNKAAIRDALKDETLSPRKRKILELRQRFALTTAKKLDAFLARHVKGSIHDGVIYGGAERTLRYSGQGVQLQNIARGAGAETVDMIEQLAKGVRFDNPKQACKDMMRGFMVGPWFIGDYSQIEARTLASMAGDDEMLKAFSTGQDPYRLKAAEIYGIEPEEVTADQRFMGKQTVLGCGYGLGKHGFAYMLDETYDVQIELDESARIVNAYRKSSPQVPKLWRRVMSGIQAALARPGDLLQVAAGLRVKAGQHSFYLQLPSGRKLYYRRLRREDLTFYARKKNGSYGQEKLYGGKVVGYIIQSIARDLMAEALVRLVKAEYDVRLTLHDEAGALAHPGQTLDGFAAEMRRAPGWAKALGIPIEVECFEAPVYHK